MHFRVVSLLSCFLLHNNQSKYWYAQVFAVVISNVACTGAFSLTHLLTKWGIPSDSGQFTLNKRETRNVVWTVQREEKVFVYLTTARINRQDRKTKQLTYKHSYPDGPGRRNRWPNGEGYAYSHMISFHMDQVAADHTDKWWKEWKLNAHEMFRSLSPISKVMNKWIQIDRVAGNLLCFVLIHFFLMHSLPHHHKCLSGHFSLFPVTWDATLFSLQEMSTSLL